MMGEVVHTISLGVILIETFDHLVYVHSFYVHSGYI
jgi:hypothetical protein